MSVWYFMLKAPPLPFLPEAEHGKEVFVLAFMYAGDPEEGQEHISVLNGFGESYSEHVGVMPYTDWQHAFDPLLGPGAGNYWKSHNFTELKDETASLMIDYAGTLASPQCEIFVAHIVGAANRVAENEMAYRGTQ